MLLLCGLPASSKICMPLKLITGSLFLITFITARLTCMQMSLQFGCSVHVKEFSTPSQGVNTPTSVQHSRLPFLITPLIAHTVCWCQRVLSWSMTRHGTRQLVTWGLPRHDPRPELDTLSYEVPENELHSLLCVLCMQGCKLLSFCKQIENMKRHLLQKITALINIFKF